MRRRAILTKLVARMGSVAGFAAALLAVSGVARAQGSSAAEACLAANQRIVLGAPLPRTASHMHAGESLRIVAVGSSSTTGLWVLRSSATYPEVMARESSPCGRAPTSKSSTAAGRRYDQRHDPAVRARFLAYRPDLVIWQLGTNDVAWGGNADGLKDVIVNGVRTLKASGADVILMDLQYAPMVLATSQHTLMQAAIAEAARQERVGLFSRFALMRRSIDAGLSPGALVSWDGLHNSAAGYDCVGRALARALDAGVR